MNRQDKNLPEQADTQEGAGFSADALVIGVAVGLVLGAVMGFLIDRITLCLAIAILAGLVVGYLIDRRRDRAAGIVQSPMSFWTAEKKQDEPTEEASAQEVPQENADEASQQQTEEEHETEDL